MTFYSCSHSASLDKVCEPKKADRCLEHATPVSRNLTESFFIRYIRYRNIYMNEKKLAFSFPRNWIFYNDFKRFNDFKTILLSRV